VRPSTPGRGRVACSKPAPACRPAAPPSPRSFSLPAASAHQGQIVSVSSGLAPARNSIRSTERLLLCDGGLPCRHRPRSQVDRATRSFMRGTRRPRPLLRLEESARLRHLLAFRFDAGPGWPDSATRNNSSACSPAVGRGELGVNAVERLVSALDRLPVQVGIGAREHDRPRPAGLLPVRRGLSLIE
jgi:hypothetical protein